MSDDIRDDLEQAIGPAAATRVLQDAESLERLLDRAIIRREYIDPILRGDQGAVSELFVAARLSATATDLTPHARGHGSRRCDLRAEFNGDPVFVEVKKQRDAFPFNSPGTEVQPGLTTYTGSRPSADPRYLGAAPPHTTDPVPSATIWRDALEEAAAQLPRDQPGIIAVECDASGDLDIDIGAALFGDPVLLAGPHPRGWGSQISQRRLGNGFFGDERFQHVAGVWFFRLAADWSADPPVQKADWARGARNPNYTGSELPEEIAQALMNVCDPPTEA